MSSIVYLTNKKTNTTYVYLNESTWDPEKKKCVCKRKCIGHIDPRTGEIVSNRKRNEGQFATVRSSALCLAFDKVSERLGLTKVLSQSFQKNWRIMLSLAYYVAATGGELLFSRQWSENNDLPYDGVLTTEVINTMLGDIAAYHISNFFTRWIEENQCTEVYTNVALFHSAYENLKKYAETLDITIDEENYGTKIELYFSAKNSKPICYTLMNMNLGRNLDNYGIKHADFKKLTTIVDAERGNRFDIDMLTDGTEHLTARIRANSPMAKRAIDGVRDRIMLPGNYKIIYGTPLFVASSMNYLRGKRYYTHVCFDPNRAVSELSSFIAIINGCMHEIKSGDLKPEHQSIYDQYLICSADEDALIVDHNGENILHHDENTGFSVIVSNVSRDAETALNPFFEDRVIKEMFSNIINDYDNTNLNLFTESHHQTRIFVQFLALIIRTEMEQTMRVSNLSKTVTYKEIVDELENIKSVSIPGVRKRYFTETTPMQKRILQLFDLDAQISSEDVRGQRTRM